MVIAAGINGVGVIPLYSSKDFINWEYEGEIWNSEEDWIKGVKMIECPDLFKLPGTDLYALKYSLEVPSSPYVEPNELQHEQRPHGCSCCLRKQTAPYTGLELYELGRYTQRQFIRDRRLNRGLFDYGHLYASKTFWDDKTGTRVLWGWSSEEDEYGAERGWQGIMALPRKVIFDEKLGQLRTPPVDAVDQLRSSRLLSKSRLDLKHLTETVLPVSGNQLEVSFDVPINQCDGGFSVQLHVRRSQVGTEYTAVTVTPSSTQKCGTIGVDRAKAGGSTPTSSYAAPVFCTDANRDVVSVRVFVDVSVVEAYANDGVSVITARVYPPEEYSGVALLAITRGSNCAVAVENLQVYYMSSIGLDQ